jgi:uncharacterized SAM-binding protein YcdF (DUF218 family)
MFDSNLCDRPFPERPFIVDWLTFIWFNRPLFIAFTLLCLFGIYWMIRHTQWKRRFNRRKIGLWLLGFSVAFLVMLFVTDKVLLLFLPKNLTTGADAIVILGRGPLFNEPRVERAVERWQAKPTPMIFVSGRGDAFEIIKRLEAKGIPKTVLDGENCSVTTQENAVFTAAILQLRGIRRIILITDWPHMWRSLLVFRAYGFEVAAQTSEIPYYAGGLRARFFLRIREYMALVNYGLRGLYVPQDLSQLPSSELEKLVDKAEQYGQQRNLQT